MKKILILFIIFAAIFLAPSILACTSDSQCYSGCYGKFYCNFASCGGDGQCHGSSCSCSFTCPGSQCNSNGYPCSNCYNGKYYSSPGCSSICQCSYSGSFTCKTSCSGAQCNTGDESKTSGNGCNNACQKKVCDTSSCQWSGCQNDIQWNTANYGNECCYNFVPKPSDAWFSASERRIICYQGIWYATSSGWTTPPATYRTSCSQIGSFYSDGSIWMLGTAEGQSCGTNVVCRSGSCVSCLTTYYRDVDLDNEGNPSVSQSSCTNPGAGWVTNNIDCNDNNRLINSTAADICDGINNDCKAATADGSGETAPLCLKQAGICLNSRKSCSSGAWQTCTDANYLAFNSAYQSSETSCSDLKDNDCNGLTDMQDPNCDRNPPLLELKSGPAYPKIKEQVDINASARDTESGIKNITIYVDSQIVKNCTIAPVISCNVSLSYVKARPHKYNITVYDNVGNVNKSSGNFTVISNPLLNCSENTNNTGIICKTGESCFGGIFVNTSDGSGLNAGTSEPGDAKCCDGAYCSLSALLPFCTPPIGTEYNISIASCPDESKITSLVQVSSPGLECCRVQPQLKSGIGFNVYWSRQTSGYAQLTEAAEGDSLYCIATSAGPVTFEVKKPSATIPAEQVPVGTGGIKQYSVLADETGTFTCNATDSSGKSAVATITITEVEKSAVALPFFGFFEFIAALMLIIIYLVCRVKILKGIIKKKKSGGSK